MRTNTKTAALGALLLLGGGLGSAEDLGGLALHGFASQGYLRSSDNRYLSMDTDEGSFAFTEAALNFTALPTPRLRIAGQLFARDLGPSGNNRVTVDWALGDYRFRDWLGLRAGKVKLPLGLYNVLIDADVARPEIMQPPGLYPLALRDQIAAFQGAELYGTLTAGAAGQLDYEAWVGTVDVDEAYMVRGFLATGANAIVPALPLAGTTVQLANVEATMERMVGGALEWRPLAGLRLRATGFTARSDFAADANYFGYAGPAPVAIAAHSTLALDQGYEASFSTEYQNGPLRLTAEHYRAGRTMTSRITGLPLPFVPEMRTEARPSSTYAQLAYRLNDTFWLSGYYSVFYFDRDDKQGAALAAAGLPPYASWLKQWTFTARADITRNWLLKAEVGLMDGTAGVTGAEDALSSQQDWTLFSLKTTFHF